MPILTYTIPTSTQPTRVKFRGPDMPQQTGNGAGRAAEVWAREYLDDLTGCHGPAMVIDRRPGLTVFGMTWGSLHLGIHMMTATLG